MIESITKKQKQLLDQIAKNHGLENYQITLYSDRDADEGHLSRVKFISLHNADDKQQLNIVMKVAPTSKNLRKQIPTRECFLREIHMYDKLFPEFIKFQNAFNIPKPFKAIPKVYGTISDEFYETIILENLKCSGYKVYNRLEPLTSEHLALVITEYARLHAVSFAMKHLDLEKFDQVANRVKYMDANFFQGDSNHHTLLQQKEIMFKLPFEALKDNPVAIEALKNGMATGIRYFYDTPKDNGDLVLGHCDCWSMNMLYKYEDQNRPKSPTKVCIIDWQFPRLTTPIFDISYFLYISAGKQDLNNYLHYLHLYHNTLSDNLKAFGLDSNKIYSYENLTADWKKYCATGFSIAVFMLGQTLSEEELPRFEDIADQGVDVLSVNSQNGKVTDLYTTRLTDIIDFVIKNNFV